HWIKKAAENGHVNAMYDLGSLYDSGQGVQQNYTEAVKWTKMSADKGHVGAMYNLGAFYESGEGIPQNYTEAFKWYQQAAGKGHEKAKQALPRVSLKVRQSLGNMAAKTSGSTQTSSSTAKQYQQRGNLIN